MSKKRRLIIAGSLLLSLPVAHKLVSDHSVTQVKPTTKQIVKAKESGATDTEKDTYTRNKETTNKPDASLLKQAEPIKKVEPVAKKAEPIKKPEPAAKKAEPVKKVEPAAKKAEPVKKVEPAAKKAEPVKKTEPAAKKAEPVKKVEPAAKKAEPVKKVEPAAKKAEPAKTVKSSKVDTATAAVTAKSSGIATTGSVAQKADAILAKVPSLNPKVLKMALTAYTNANKKGYGSKNNILTIIDYSKPGDQKRLWVLDLNKNKVLYHTLVAHGKNTGDRHAKHFSNVPNSKASSMGLFITKGTYHGSHGLSLRIHGLDKGFNDNVLKRAVVFHGASYVSEYVAKAYGRIGRSWGCPAVPQALSTPIINTIKNGTLVFAYAPSSLYELKSKFLKG